MGPGMGGYGGVGGKRPSASCILGCQWVGGEGGGPSFSHLFCSGRGAVEYQGKERNELVLEIMFLEGVPCFVTMDLH